MPVFQRIASGYPDCLLKHYWYINKKQIVLTKLVLFYANNKNKVINVKFITLYMIIKSPETPSKTWLQLC